MTLNELRLGESGTITKVNGEGIVRDRLLDMGLTPKTEIFLRKCAPLGDPMELTLRGYELTIRKEDAKMIQIDKHPDGYVFGNSCNGNCCACFERENRKGGNSDNGDRSHNFDITRRNLASSGDDTK